MIETGEPKREQGLTGQHNSAKRHPLDEQSPVEPEIYTRLSTLLPWLDEVIEACQKPTTNLERAAGWILDNDYQIRRAIRQVTEDLPKGFYLKLPATDTGDDALPRSLYLATAALDDSRLQPSLSGLVEYVDAYQHAVVLHEAELWAFPALARLYCLDILVSAVTVLIDQIKRPVAGLFGDADARSNAHESALELIPLHEASERVARAITSLTILSNIDWHIFVDRTSHLEATLRKDPAKIYANMDRRTRSRYRNEIELIASRCAHSEIEVAEHTNKLASQEPENQRTNHVGYWLIDEGRHELESCLSVSIGFRLKLERFVAHYAGSIYALSLMSMVIALLLFPVWYATRHTDQYYVIVVASLLSLFPASVISISVTNWLVTRLISPVELPALNTQFGIPDGYDTAIAIPVIVQTEAEVNDLIERLELRQLANSEEGLCYVLLSDPPDASVDTEPSDVKIEAALIAGIRQLNSRYTDPLGDRFLLLHRHREYNPAEACWMAFERKRGKLQQFSRLIIDGHSTAFAVTEGDLTRLSKSRYVISLDADTMLPPGSALQLVCTLAHPLNHAVVDSESGSVNAGYTVLQPRIETLTHGQVGSLFAQIFAGDTAIDIYSRAVSDVYQDLFGVGSYVGKGIFDVRTFEQSLANRVPDNTILSHDLFEGLHGRVGLATNVVLYEQYPETWPEHAARQHRWIRGDWQLVPWLGPTVPAADQRRERNKFSVLGRWKLIDNLRRSVIPIAMLAFLLCAWFVFPGSAWVWTLLAIVAFAPYLIDEAFASLAQLSRRNRPHGFAHRGRTQLSRWALSVVFLVVDAINSIDAIVRTLWRVFVSHRHLLQWKPSAHMHNALHGDSVQGRVWRLMWPSPVFAVFVAVSLFLGNAASLIAASPVLLGWFLAPLIAAKLSQPRHFRRDSLSPEGRLFLRTSARKTWHYFDNFCRPEDNWLPPDNFQSQPGPLLAHRTSPTNIGLYLTSTLAAHDFGFIGTREFAVRARNVLDAIDRLPKHRGHILNWYDTRTLAPLEPRYVSTVDSGNLAICLLAVKQGCQELAGQPLYTNALALGMSDTFRVLTDSLRELKKPISGETIGIIEKIESHIESFTADTINIKLDSLLRTTWPRLEQLIAQELAEITAAEAEALSDIHVWLERFDHHLRTVARDIDDFAPWVKLLATAPANCQSMSLEIATELTLSNPLSTIRPRLQQVQDMVDGHEKHISPKSEEARWCQQIRETINRASSLYSLLLDDLERVAARASKLAYGMEFDWLYDTNCHLFCIGYNVSSDMLDVNHYDLLASEARMASFFAIAKHDVPIMHWFHLGRPVVRHAGQPAAQSWNGSMFEYLMPPLFLPGKRDTFLGESESVAVSSQRGHAATHDVPWGVSESAFAATDAEGNYQYRAFGTPGLGIRRGLSDDLVIAPYASMLALGVWPEAAVNNLQRLASLGVCGRYGFIDALDYTPDRLVSSKHFVSVNTWMAHHQGMSMVAIDNVLMADRMPQRVLAEKSMRAVELLLQERIPWDAPTEKTRPDETIRSQSVTALPSLPGPWLPIGPRAIPQLQLLGNGRLSARVSRRGGGGLFYRNISLTRWTPDAQNSARGYRIHVSDASTGLASWLGSSDLNDQIDDTQVMFGHDRIEMVRRIQDVTIRLDIAIASHDDVDIRRVSITNDRNETATLSITSYAEVALAKAADDERHPAFSKLFVGSRSEEDHDGVSFVRRPRHPEDKSPYLLHRVVIDESCMQLSGFETNRLKWLGRLGVEDSPQALSAGLSGSTGWTLDPVMALQVQANVPPGETRTFAFLTLAGESRQHVLDRSSGISVAGIDRLFRDAALDAAQELRHLELNPSDLPDLQNLASLLIYPQASMRSAADAQPQPTGGQSGLWPFGLSGDLPVLLLYMDDDASPELLDMLLRAQSVWRRRGLMVDLVVLRTGPASYEEPLRILILDTLRDADSYGWLGRDGGVHLLSAANMTENHLAVLTTFASVVLHAHRALGDCLDALLSSDALPPRLQASDSSSHPVLEPPARAQDLLFDNGLGGFDPASSEYLIYLNAGQCTPSPWSNVLANERFGSIVTEAGLGFSWGANSGEHRLTTWSNDPVLDKSGEMLYLRDEATAEIWTVTPTSNTHESAIRIRHGFGYTQWDQNSHGLEQELLAFVDIEAPVKVVRLKLRNHTAIDRRITATFYAEWLLGAVASQARPHVVTHYDANIQAIVARNAWNPEFSSKEAFLCSSHKPHSITGNRNDFLGGNADLLRPEGLLRSDLGGSFSAGSDPCAAYQVHLDIAANAESELLFVLGEGDSHQEVAQLVSGWRSKALVDDALIKLRAHWSRANQAVQVRTPDRAFDLMVNHWLIYQTLSSRLYARAGFYQAGGAFGFRDQLQDCLALIPSDPARVRRQILLAAEHQFEEGDVLHWWHPPAGRGVRTRISDDRLWLPNVTARYIEATDDWALLNVSVPFLHAPILGGDEEDRYAGFDQGQHASLYEHCCRALECGLATGEHGLPLIGTGDWNDGMDRIGHKGQGESVWLGWFQISVINALVPMAEYQGEGSRAVIWQEHASALKKSIDTHAWDGNWFLRAFDDDGVPWGSSTNDECQIDVIAQAWGALAGFGKEQQVLAALQAVQEHLVDDDLRIVRLLTPPFHHCQRNPGYIKAYPPGIRENGGQYTHAAAWLGLAFASIGDGDDAYKIFDFINPISRSGSAQAIQRYEREPYVLTADIGGAEHNAGRGGWSWYTGSASWTWQLAVNGLLGIHHQSDGVRIEPCLPCAWDHVDIMLDAPRGTIAVRIDNPDHVNQGIVSITIDGVASESNIIAFPEHSDVKRVVILLGSQNHTPPT